SNNEYSFAGGRLRLLALASTRRRGGFSPSAPLPGGARLAAADLHASKHSIGRAVAPPTFCNDLRCFQATSAFGRLKNSPMSEMKARICPTAHPRSSPAAHGPTAALLVSVA